MSHPAEFDLALFAGGEAGRVHRYFMGRHLRNCEDCQEKVAAFRSVRDELAETELPDLNWNFLAQEMRANIRVGLEAGACVRKPARAAIWAPRFAVAFASMLVVVGAAFFVTQSAPRSANAPDATAPVLQATGSGIELRKGTESFALMDRQDARTDQTVSAQGAIERSYVNGETGSVTITNVYLQQ